MLYVIQMMLSFLLTLHSPFNICLTFVKRVTFQHLNNSEIAGILIRILHLAPISGRGQNLRAKNYLQYPNILKREFRCDIIFITLLHLESDWTISKPQFLYSRN